MSFISQHPYLIIAVVALLLNIPCGYVREGHQKFSFRWFFWIHASIPFLIYLRLTLKASPWFIPVAIAIAVIGQMIGGRIKKWSMTEDDIEQKKQIPDLNIISKQSIPEAELTVALLNMGGPKTNTDVKDFQMHLFSDARLIRFPLAFVFQKLFAWILVNVRLKASQARYQKIGGGSPIYESTIRQVRALQNELNRRGHVLDVTFSFNYSPPFPDTTIQELKERNKKYILPLSLYPHYSNATTGSNIFYLKKAAQQHYPSLIFLHSPAYYLHDGYVDAFVDRIREQLRAGESLDDFYLVFSAHGLPHYSLTEGDPYPFQISQMVAKILNKLNRGRNWVISYQSAVGPLQWLRPSTDDIIAALAKRGIKKLLMIPVSFVGDHIETICEIDIEYRELAHKIGIEDYRMSKAIESHPRFIEALADSVEAVLASPETKQEPTQNVNLAVGSKS